MYKQDTKYIPYTESFQLMNLKFDEFCHACYNMIDNKPNFQLIAVPCRNSHIFNNKSGRCVAPTYSEAFDFFRTTHNLDSFVMPMWDDDNNKTYLFCYGNAKLEMTHDDEEFKTHQEAEHKCLVKLIPIVTK